MGGLAAAPARQPVNQEFPASTGRLGKSSQCTVPLVARRMIHRYMDLVAPTSTVEIAAHQRSSKRFFWTTRAFVGLHWLWAFFRTLSQVLLSSGWCSQYYLTRPASRCLVSQHGRNVHSLAPWAIRIAVARQDACIRPSADAYLSTVRAQTMLAFLGSNPSWSILSTPSISPGQSGTS